MKLVIFFITIACLQVSASALAQKITLNEKDAPLEKVFNDIKNQTGFNFFYEHNILNGASKVTINVKDASLQDVLDQCLKDQPLVYTIAGNTVGVKKKDKPIVQTPPAPAADITGRVTNKQGEPLSGATVLIKRTKTGTLADANGRFTIRSVEQTDILLVSFIGYKTLEVPVGTKTVFNVSLEEASNALDQVVVQAYGQTSQRLNTGNIGVVRAETIEKQPVMNPLLALEGQVAGLDIVQQSGYASAPVKVELRGRASIGAFPSDPLYVIDGVPLTVNDVNTNGPGYPLSPGFIQNGLNGPAKGQSPLFSINPDDIESISVLKDAVATSIYGSRGAQGVVLITTKKGQAGKTKLEASIQDGISEVTGLYPLLNTQQYLAVRREAFKNDGIVPTAANAPDLLLWDQNQTTNWQKALYGRFASDVNANISLSGGDARTTFRVSGAFRRDDQITTISGAEQNANISFDLTHKSLNQLFTLELKTQYSYGLIDLTNLPGRLTFPPNTPPIFDAQGNLNYAGWAPIASQYPFAGLLQPYSSTTDFLNSVLTLSFHPMHGLTIKSNFGYNYVQLNQQSSTPIISQDPTTNPVATSQFGYNNHRNWIVEPQATYDAAISKGKLSALVGASMQSSISDGVLLTGRNYTNDALIHTITNAASIGAIDSYGQYKFAGLFGRLNYNWEDKYLIDLSARRDGSSKFGPGKEFGNFAAAGVAWIFSEEDWAKKNLSFLSFGKLRSSYGTTGSDFNTSLYSYLSRYSSSGLQTYGGLVSLRPTQLANPSLQWQSNNKFEVALEAGFLKDRINFTVNYYNDRTGNQLISYPLPTATGFTSVSANFPAVVQNAGFEFTLQGKIIDAKDFKWSANINTGINTNKIVSFPNLAQSSYANSIIIGRPINLVRLLHYTGVDPLTGQYTFQDKNNDGIINTGAGPADDRFAYDFVPKLFGGFGTNFNYKKLALSLFFNFKKQIGPNLIAQGDIPGRMYNQPIDIIGKEWQKPGDITNVARYTTQPASSDGYLQASNAGYTDASFIRLKNIQLSYDLPLVFVKKLGMQRCNLFFRGQNVFVITPYKGIDPETQNYGGLPPVKTFVGGLSFNY
ncbi:MAG: SusC/RagA family TonB-linked outer membrane protein [Sphingobacteriales bacterium]